MENHGKVNPGVIVTPCHRNSGMSEDDYARCFCSNLDNVAGFPHIISWQCCWLCSYHFSTMLLVLMITNWQVSWAQQDDPCHGTARHCARGLNLQNYVASAALPMYSNVTTFVVFPGGGDSGLLGKPGGLLHHRSNPCYRRGQECYVSSIGRGLPCSSGEPWRRR